MLFKLISCYLVVFTLGVLQAENPIEAGKVKWGRKLDVALNQSQKSGKPIFALFQEIPGCAGCREFGRGVLSNELLVEAIEEEFVPLLIYNNRSGYDQKILKQFNEPSWNYQVIRFLDENGKDIIPRKDRVWDIGGLSKRMLEALKTYHRPEPNYLKSIELEYSTHHHQESAFAMYCFWTGEMKLGGIEGVVKTEAGWLEGREVTKVTYDKNIISAEKLTELAKQVKCASKIYLDENQINQNYRRAKESDQKKQIEKLKDIPYLNAVQASKLNALAPVSFKDGMNWLSPKQRQYLVSKLQ